MISMRMKDFFIRTGIFLPMALWGILISLLIIGIVASLFGAGPLFYCTVYCKIALFLLIGAVVAVIYCQARACSKK